MLHSPNCFVEDQTYPPSLIVAVEANEDMFKVSVGLAKCSEVPILVDAMCALVPEIMCWGNDTILDSPYVALVVDHPARTIGQLQNPNPCVVLTNLSS